LGNHRACIHPGVEKHDRDARNTLPGQYGTLNWSRPSVLGQKRPVNIQGPEWKNVQERLWNNLTESHYDGAFRTVRPDFFDNFATPYTLGLVYWNSCLDRQGFDRRFMNLAAPSARTVGLSDYKADPGFEIQ
jgi:hypothetical protein